MKANILLREEAKIRRARAVERRQRAATLADDIGRCVAMADKDDVDAKELDYAADIIERRSVGANGYIIRLVKDGSFLMQVVGFSIVWTSDAAKAMRFESDGHARDFADAKRLEKIIPHHDHTGETLLSIDPLL